MNVNSQIKHNLKLIWGKIRSFSRLEVIGLVAIAILVLNSFFEVAIAVKRKPFLDKILQAGNIRLANTPKQSGGNQSSASNQGQDGIDQALADKVLPSQGVELPVVWGGLGKDLVKAGVIDRQKLESLYAQRGGIEETMKKMMDEDLSGKLKITETNASSILNMFWALGLGNKNEILDKGEMQDKQYGGAGKFASTGGWTLAAGDTMDHYSKHGFIRLTADQQALVDRVSKGIFRPCCGNSTHFPDCNHGMAMLGLLELMAAQGVSEQDMYKYALAVNAYWFPNNYLTVASYLKSQGKDWDQADPREILGSQFSSSQGFRQIQNQVAPITPRNGGGCGV